MGCILQASVVLKLMWVNTAQSLIDVQSGIKKSTEYPPHHVSLFATIGNTSNLGSYQQRINDLWTIHDRSRFSVRVHQKVKKKSSPCKVRTYRSRRGSPKDFQVLTSLLSMIYLQLGHSLHASAPSSLIWRFEQLSFLIFLATPLQVISHDLQQSNYIALHQGDQDNAN